MMKKNFVLSLILVAMGILFTSCNQSARNKETCQKRELRSYKGKEIFLFTLTNKEGNVLKLTNYGARITWIEMPDRAGKKENVTFGYDTFDSLINGDPYFGATVGRYAGRIAKGKFLLDGEEFFSFPQFWGKCTSWRTWWMAQCRLEC